MMRQGNGWFPTSLRFSRKVDEENAYDSFMKSELGFQSGLARMTKFDAD